MALALGCTLALKRGWTELFVSLRTPAQISSKAWNKRYGSAKRQVTWWSRHPERSVAGQRCWAPTHKKAESVANFDLVAGLVPTAYSSDQSVLNHLREEEPGQHLTPPTRNQQTVYVLPKASLKEITDLPVTVSFLEIKLLSYKCKSIDQ